MSGAFELSETVGYEEALTYQGKTCRIGTGWQLLPASGNYMTMRFHTPVSGMCYYAFATVQKTGDELEITLVEGGTYTGGGGWWHTELTVTSGVSDTWLLPVQPIMSIGARVVGSGILSFTLDQESVLVSGGNFED